MKIRKILKETWNFIWNSNSWLSWVVNVLLAFLIVKFIFYPGVGLLFSTDYPIVAVVSESMEHDGDFDLWWNSQKDFYSNYNISKEEFLNYDFKNGFSKGDIMVVFGKDFEKLERGDVIVFKASLRNPIIHRIIVKNEEEKSFTTKGDHNLRSRGDEIGIKMDRIHGKAVLRVPYLGWIKILAVDLIRVVKGVG
jgi:signal peptidase I